MKNKFIKILKKLTSSYFYQFAILAGLVLLGFYKVFNFTFHANKEMSYIIGLTGGDFTFMNLLKSHGFVLVFNYKIFGTNPAGWYLTGVILHIIALWLLVYFVGTLLKSRVLGFLTGIFFGISLVWHDVITFGTQQSMYALVFILFFISIIFYKRFREGKNIVISYIISTISLTLALPVREIALIFFPVLFAYDIIFFFKYNKRYSVQKNLKLLVTFLLPQLLFIIIALGFFIFSQTHGSVPHYGIDERVRYRNNLFAQKAYLKYIIISILSYGTFIPPHFIPYPLLNYLRDVFSVIVPIYYLKVFLFTILGTITYLFMIFLTFRNICKPYFKVLFLSLIIIAIPTIFYSSSITMDEVFFLKPYDDESNRWRYYAYFGTSLFVITYLFNKLKEKFKEKKTYTIIGIIVAVNFFVQLFFLWQVQDRMYETQFQQQKLFYKTLFKVFPSYSRDYTIYHPPRSYSLGDFLSEWRHTINFYYPNIKELRADYSYNELEKLLSLITDGKMSLDKIFFIDFNPSQGVIDYTKEARKNILSQKNIPLGNNVIIKRNKKTFPVKEILPIEFPYVAHITIQAYLDNENSAESILDNKKLDALLAHTISQVSMKNNINLEVCGTYGNMVVYDKNKILDGNFGENSSWNVDCFPGWFIIDFGKTQEVVGFLMSGLEGDSHLPRNYYYEVSMDGKNWEKVMEVKNSVRFDIMDKWPASYKAKYIKVTIDSTQKSGYAFLDEVQPVYKNAEGIFSYYKSWKDLRNDMYTAFSKVSSENRSIIINKGLNYSFGRLGWKTNLLNIPEDQTSIYFPFKIDGSINTYELPLRESEIFSSNDQFFRRKITDVTLDFSNFPGTVIVDDITLKPKYPIEKVKQNIN